MTGALSQGKDIIELWTEIRRNGSHITFIKMPGSVHRKNGGSGGSWAEGTLAEFVHHGGKR